MDEVGNWEGGKTFNGEIVGDPRFEDGYPVSKHRVLTSPQDRYVQSWKLSYLPFKILLAFQNAFRPLSCVSSHRARVFNICKDIN